MYFNEIIHATQYYRAPTPKKEEWDGDISRLDDINLDTFQIRINWRWNERIEGIYDFSDIDELFNLAEKHNKKVIIKFLLECAPQYIFDKYNGTIIGPKGEMIRGGAHGAFYGGWKPCFTNPHVQYRAELFVEEVVKRYKDRKCLILYNAWNEIRNKPVEECFCPYCRAAFGEYLRDKFGTIENLNNHYGAAEESFEHIALPSMPHGYWDIFEFKKFKGSHELARYLGFVRDAIKRHDTQRPIMSHTGFCSAFQTHIGDVCDDFAASRAVDFFGTSIPCLCNMDTEAKRLDFFMLQDYVRSLDQDYFLYEIYPGLGMFNDEYDTPFDMSFKLHAALASGVKGLVYWQYRAERVGMENDCAGLMRADGSPRLVSNAVSEFGNDLRKNMSYLADAYPKCADVAIVFDFDSMILSEIEDACGDNYSFAERKNPLHYYKESHTGMYQLLVKNGIEVDYISSREPQKLSRYKAIYLPYYNMLNSEFTKHLTDYIKDGGIVIADEGFGLREMNTWMQPYDMSLPDMTVKMRERRQKSDVLVIDGKNVATYPFKTEYDILDADVVLRFSDSSPAIWESNCGNGKMYFFAFGIGYTYMKNSDSRIASIILDLLKKSNISTENITLSKKNVYIRTTHSEKYTIKHIFNCSDKSYESDEYIRPVAFSSAINADSGRITVAPKSCAYYIIENR